MKRLFSHWDKLLPYERVFHALLLGFSIITVIVGALALFRLVGLWMPLLGLAAVQFCQAVYSWRQQREIGLMGLFAGSVVLIVMVSMLFV